jgi:hypothetical protein
MFCWAAKCFTTVPTPLRLRIIPSRPRKSRQPAAVPAFPMKVDVTIESPPDFFHPPRFRGMMFKCTARQIGSHRLSLECNKTYSTATPGSERAFTLIFSSAPDRGGNTSCDRAAQVHPQLVFTSQSRNSSFPIFIILTLAALLEPEEISPISTSAGSTRTLAYRGADIPRSLRRTTPASPRPTAAR